MLNFLHLRYTVHLLAQKKGEFMNDFHQKNKLFLMLIVCGFLILPACKKTKKTKPKHTHSHEKHARIEKKEKTTDSINIPLEQDALAFDTQDLSELFDDTDSGDATAENNSPASSFKTADAQSSIDYEWTDSDTDDEHTFKTIYFDFDKHKVRNDQQESVTYDAVQLKQYLAEATVKGKAPQVVIEGHACSSAGSKEYNFSISHNRAQEVAKLLAKEGVPAENIKVVGRGQDIPAVVNGKTVAGSKNDQWANRRVEVHILNS